MEPNQPELLDSIFTEKQQIRRRALLPWWIKTFAWIFMGFGGLAFICLVLGLFGARLQLAFYGLETWEPLSVTGLAVIAIALLKGITAYALWMEKEWAINIGQLDATLGIVICVLVMIYPYVDQLEASRFNFRLELVLLIPYLIRLRAIKGPWMERTELQRSW